MMLYRVMYGKPRGHALGMLRDGRCSEHRGLLDREELERSRPLGRALDLGCGRGQKTVELARRGWEAVGLDNVPQAIDAADRRGVAGATFVVGDVTDLEAVDLGRFDFLNLRREARV